MEMMMIIGVFLCGLVVFYGIKEHGFQKRKKKRKMELALSFYSLTIQHKLTIEHSEHTGNRIFALDRKNKKFLVVDRHGPSKNEICISLTAVQSTRIVKERNAQGFIQKVCIELTQTGNSNIIVCFFDDAIDHLLHLPGALRKAKNWKHRLDLYTYAKATVPAEIKSDVIIRKNKGRSNINLNALPG